MCSARRRIPFGLGYWNNLEYILVAFGFDAGKEMGGAVQAKEKVLKNRAKMAKGINHEGKEDHITTEEVADKSVAIGHHGGAWVTFVDTTEFPFFVCLKM